MVVLTGVFITLYGTILLPLLISFKTQNIQHRFLFWLYFIKSRLHLNGLLVYLALPLFFLLNIAIILTPYTFTTEVKYHNLCTCNNQHESKLKEIAKQEITVEFNTKDILELGHFSLILTIIGLWITVLTIIFSDIIKSYDQLSKGFSEYSSLILEEKLLRERKINAVLIGYGLLSRIPLGHLLAKSLNAITSDSYPLRQFELIIDKSLSPRLIPRQITIIEKQPEKYDDVYEDKENGLKYGIISCHDIILKRSGHTPIYDPILAIFGIVDDGTSVQSLKSFSLEKLSYIINTSSDPNSGLALAQILRALKGNTKPNLITTVNDTTSFSILENISTLPIFPIYPGMQEGWSLGSRLFLLFTQDFCKPKELNKNKNDDPTKKEDGENQISPEIGFSINNYSKIIFIGRGKELFYTINSFLLLLDNFQNKIGFNKNQDLKNYLMENSTILTDEECITSTIEDHSKHKKDEKFNFSKIHIGHEKYLGINIEIVDPTRTNKITRVLSNIIDNENKNSKKYIFVAVSSKPFEELRMLQIIKQSISHLGLGRINLISNVHEMNIDLYKRLCTTIEDVTERYEADYFYPKGVSELVIPKYRIQGNQISSLCDYLDQSDETLFNKDGYNLTSDKRSISKTGEISICANDKPGVFLKTLCKLSGIENLKPTRQDILIPEFFYANSFSVKDVDIDIDHTFMFMGDCSLGSYQNNNLLYEQISGCNVNGTSTFEKEFKSFFNDYSSSNNKTKECGFSQKCPICTKRMIMTSNEPDSLNKDDSKKTVTPFARIILWGEKDDVPGALAIALSDLLLLGSDLQYTESIDHSQILNIMQTNLIPCSYNNQYTIRLYGSHREVVEKNFNKDRNKLKSNRNIIGVKIKLNGVCTKEWKTYFDALQNYIDNTSAYTYDSIQASNEWYIFRTDFYGKTNMKLFFDSL